LKKYIATIAIIIGILIAYYFITNRPEERQPTILLEIQSNPGGKVKPEPGKYLYNHTNINITLHAYPLKDYIFQYWLINNSKVVENPLKITLNGNTTIKPYFKRIYFYIKLNSNGTLLLNGSEVKTPYTLRYREKITVNISGIRRLMKNTIYYPKSILLDNRSVENPIILEYRNASIILLYGVEKGGVNKILITSNAAKYCYINGCRIDLPAYIYVSSPTKLHGEFSIPLNKTHSYWLGWYTIKYKNNETKSTSYYRNKSIEIANNIREVEIYYVRGLKNLPYVLKIHYFPPYVWDYSGKYWQCHARIENDSIIFYNFTNPYFTDKIGTWIFVTIFFEFDYNVSGIWIYYNAYGSKYIGRPTSTTFWLKFMPYNSSMKFVPHIYTIVQSINIPHITYINTTHCIIDEGWIPKREKTSLGWDIPLLNTYGRNALFFAHTSYVVRNTGDRFIVVFRVLGVES